ncbi:MAG: helix-turn-helix domain-containing protein [Planctomycetaceae bacterium]|nr:helix-turn-helix domain-containing protein [Planctomycetaceae bacterium]
MDATTIREVLKSYATAAQAAKKLRIGIRAVQTACERGHLPGAVLIGREWRIPQAAILARIAVHGRGKIVSPGRPKTRG